MSRRKEVARQLRKIAAGPITTRAIVEAADLLDPPDDESTVEVRVLVRTELLTDGSLMWSAVGGSWRGRGLCRFLLTEQASQQVKELGRVSDVHVLTEVIAHVPKPQPSAEVEGMVVDEAGDLS